MKENGTLFKRKLNLVICSRVKANEEALVEDQVGGTRPLGTEGMERVGEMAVRNGRNENH